MNRTTDVIDLSYEEGYRAGEKAGFEEGSRTESDLWKLALHGMFSRELVDSIVLELENIRNAN